MYRRAIFRFRHWQLLRRREKVSRKYDKYIQLARSQKANHDEIDELQHTAHFESQMADEDLAMRRTIFLTEESRRFMIPGPTLTDYQESQYSYHVMLDPKTIERLNNAINAARKAEWDNSWARWMPVTALVLSLFSTLWSCTHTVP